MSNTAELTVIENPELLQVVKQSKIDYTKAEGYALGYAPFMIKINELSQDIKTMDRENPTPEMAAIARRKRLDLVKVRGAAVTKKDEDKEIILIETRLIDGLFKVVENTSKLTESEYLEIEKHQERLEAERLIKLEQSRVALLEPFGGVNQFIDLKMMDEETFQKYLSNEELAFNTRKEQEFYAEQQRIEAEKQAEIERIEKEKAEAEERERIRKENEELKKAAEVKEKQLAAERKKQEKVQAEKDRLAKIEADKQAKIQAELKAENDRISAELKAKQEAEQLAIEKEKQRVQAENADRIAKEKEKQLAPDKEKVNQLYAALKAIQIPEFATEDGKHIGETVKGGLSLIMSGVKDLAKLLK